MLLSSLDPEGQRVIYAGAFLLYAREVADWSPPPLDKPGCSCARCAPAPKPQRGTTAWFRAMHDRHREHQRSER